MVFTQHIQRIHTIVRGLALIAQRAKLVSQQAAVNRMVIHHQDHHVFIHRLHRFR